MMFTAKGNQVAWLELQVWPEMERLDMMDIEVVA